MTVRIAALEALAALSLCALFACRAPARETPIDDAVRARLARDAEAGLRAFAADRFAVLDLRVEAGHRVDLLDDFAFHNRLYFLDLTARIRWLRPLRVASKEELQRRLGAPDWTVEETERDLQLLDVLGEGARAAGAEQALSCAAAFEDLEPGLRFARIDARRPPDGASPEAGR